MQTIRIILSADKSLQQEKLELADLVENLNHSLESRDANILMLVWDGAESDLDSFKEKISETDLCLTLYYDTFDESTQSELETAYQSLCEGKNPKKIYVYFKDGEAIPEKLQAFRDSFPTKYGHFYCSFSNSDTLKADFLLQFMEYQSKNLGSNKILEVNNGKVTIDGKEYVNLKNVPFAGNNEEYNLLLKSIKQTQRLLAITDEDDPEYADYAADLQDMKEKLSKMESSLWDTALMITRLSTTKCSERLKRAMDLFTAGDNKGAQAVLNEEEIERDVEHNIHLVKLGEEGRKGLKINIEEYRLKIKTLENEMSEGWLQKRCDLCDRVLHLSISLYGENAKETADEYEVSGYAYSELGDYNQALVYNHKALAIREKIFGTEHPITSWSYNSIGCAYSELGNYPKALEYYQKALKIREKVLGVEHPVTAIQYNNIGGNMLILRDYPHALEYHQKALKIREKVLGGGHIDTADSYNNIGLIYLYQGDYSRAMEYHHKAMIIREKILEGKHPKIAMSYSNLGLIYSHINKFPLALEYYQKALRIKEMALGVEHPDTIELYRIIGDLFINIGDKKMACQWFGKAAIHGDADAQFALGLSYEFGKGVEQDYAIAVEWYKKAAEQGYSRAQRQLGHMYEVGHGVEINEKKSVEWYRKAAEQGYAEAQYYLGYMYYSGKGVEQDYKTSIEWNMMAAKQGYKYSYNGLAWTYHLMGKYEEALPWAEKAVAAFPNNPEIIDTLATVYQGLGRYDDALEQFELCFELKKERGDSEESIYETEEKIEELKKQMK
jgi:TPR repeat protein